MLFRQLFDLQTYTYTYDFFLRRTWVTIFDVFC